MEVLYRLSYPGVSGRPSVSLGAPAHHCSEGPRDRTRLAAVDSRTIKTLTLALPLGALGIAGAGVWLALGGSGWGWIIVAFGLLDLATIPFVLRTVARKSGATETAESGSDPIVHPTGNPYARED